ncbi:hypothetical protein ATANTOWER_013184 [Ataeniobius toweri]|uniref:Uncharacterized protein n=1 Tax=Ataeniobius toweri TaxID=208326 RepID=A0ABU7AGR0_9TELE|nr:hypothetical protein [Ataeniobius toweri]
MKPKLTLCPDLQHAGSSVAKQQTADQITSGNGPGTGSTPTVWRGRTGNRMRGSEVNFEVLKILFAYGAELKKVFWGVGG